MQLCKLCFQEAQSGIVVPSYQGPSGVVHEECLARAILKVSEDPQKEGLLRYLIDYEETHTPSDWAKDVSGDSADASWEWTDVGIPATKIRSLLNAGLVSIVFSTNSSTYYSLVGRNVIKEALGKAQEISKSTIEQLALWGRGGSRVIRGNLLLIPLGKSILYVEPVFLQAEAGGLPQMKRVIVVAGEQIAMEPTLAESLTAIFGAEAPPTEVVVTLPTPPEPEEVVTADIANLIEEAQRHYNKALQYQREGDWAGYGSELDALKAVLDQLVELTVEGKR